MTAHDILFLLFVLKEAEQHLVGTSTQYSDTQRSAQDLWPVLEVMQEARQILVRAHERVYGC